ncbi:TetR/AcrR family transcriptional regulator [Cellulophaga sp. 20_2_10]|uniref:TetR/AcrR family transcriptional regulator n=1 Tax=Cellulophaga sp. 20_2_10 TaxID=2942476 RepID=UPI00201B05CC|nr:TetR/AcrR family transcriptional regulator [Cellulophaga sp. 20_2_10]MCL5244297.1 TetR/AcrR family transcriptional regulator [Cellulophaga sp. 20_2_10]
MRPQKVLDKDLLTALGKVFRSKGYEGTSIKDLSEATGLKKASLYHRFPDGKEEMANSVFSHIDEWVKETIFFALNDESIVPQARLKQAIDHISTLYNGGSYSCLFRAFSMENGLQLFEKHISNGITAYIKAFNTVGLALKFNKKEATEHAVQTLIEIQGSLILTKALNDTSIFENTLKNIENRYLKQ